METRINIEGIELEEDICFQCGKKINLENVEGELFIVHVERGDKQQELPPNIYLECLDCHIDEILSEFKNSGYLKENIKLLKPEEISKNY